MDVLFFLFDLTLFLFLLIKACPDDPTFNFSLIKVRFHVSVKTGNFQ